MKQKECTRCKETKQVSKFYRKINKKKNWVGTHSYCKVCMDSISKKYLKNKPWAKTLQHILGRVNRKSHSYFMRGIKNYLTVEDLKMLWIRDKAYEMNQPSIDRKDGNEDYILENCRYIELIENLRRAKVNTIK